MGQSIMTYFVKSKDSYKLRIYYPWIHFFLGKNELF